MFSRLLVIVVAATLLLGGCMSAAEIAASDDAACRSAGAKPGTPPYTKCREDKKNQRAMAQTEGDRSMQRMMWNMNQSAMRASMPR
jgi:hypothetical protein